MVSVEGKGRSLHLGDQLPVLQKRLLYRAIPSGTAGSTPRCISQGANQPRRELVSVVDSSTLSRNNIKYVGEIR